MISTNCTGALLLLLFQVSKEAQSLHEQEIHLISFSRALSLSLSLSKRSRWKQRINQRKQFERTSKDRYQTNRPNELAPRTYRFRPSVRSQAQVWNQI